MNLRNFLSSLFTAILFVPCATHANENIYTLDDVPRPSVLAYDEQTGLPSSISVNGEISRTVLRSGKVVGFLFAQEFSGVSYVRDTTGAYVWVLRDSVNRIILLIPISVHRISEGDFTVRYIVEDGESLEVIKRTLSEQAKAERIERNNFVESLKRLSAQNAERSSIEPLRSDGACRSTCDETRDTEVELCDERLNSGNAVCDLPEGGGFGSLRATNCKIRVVQETLSCKERGANGWRQCSLKCRQLVHHGK